VLPESERKSKMFVAFATPTFTGNCAFEMLGAMERTVGALSYERIPSTHLFFVDDDVGGFQPEDVARMLFSDADIVCAVPPMKSEGHESYAVALAHGDDGGPIQEGHLLHAFQVPTAFMRIRRHVLERLAEKSDTYSVLQADGTLKVVFNIFDCGPKNGEFVGEDTAFCDKALAEGFSIMVDPHVTLTHRGQKVWRGQFEAAIQSYLAGRNPVAGLTRRRRA